MNKTLTCLVDSHTCVVGGMHLIGVVVFVSHGEFLQFTHDVIGSTSIGVPVCIHDVGGGSSRRRALLRRPHERGIEALEVAYGGVAFFAVDLAGGTVGVGVLLRTTAVVAAGSTTTPSTSTAVETTTASSCSSVGRRSGIVVV